MSGMTPEDRALLDLAREGHEPSAEDRQRVRAALVGRIGVGAGLGGAGVVKGSTALAWTIPWTKGLAIVAFVGATALGGAALVGARPAPAAPAADRSDAVRVPDATLSASGRDRHRADGAADRGDVTDPARPTAVEPAAPRPTVPGPSAPRPVAPNAPNAPNAPIARIASNAPIESNASNARVAPNALNHDAPVEPPRPWSSAPREASTSDAPNTEPAVATAPEPVAPGEAPVARTPPPAARLEAETRLLRSGIAALHAGDPGAAMSLFDEHARAFPDGALAEERDAERVLALCDLHRREDARAAAGAFLRAHVRSPLATRVRASCAGTNNP